MARLTKLFSFKNFAATRPNSPLPGQEVDNEFAEVRKAVNDIDTELKDIRRADGALNNSIVTEDSLAPGLLDKLTGPITAAVQSAKSSGGASAQIATDAANNALQNAKEAQGYAAQAHQAAQSVTSSIPGALSDINSAKAAALQAAFDAKNAAADISNDVGTSVGAALLSEKYAELSSYWAEWMGEANTPGDQTIPPNILREMGVTGDHWSSRWWANKASNAFGKLTSLYLGIHPDHATATASSTAKPPAAGSIYYNSTDNKPYIWSNAGWTPFWQPQKALQTSLFYKVVGATQTEFPLITPDLFNNSFTLDKQDTEPLEVFANGVRLFPGQAAKAATATTPAVPGVIGDYTVDPINNKIVISQALAIGTVVTIDVLTPRDKFAIGSVNFHALLNLDLDPTTKAPGLIDGTTKQFVLTRVDGKAVTAGGAEEVFISVDGVIQQPGVDYSLTGSRVTFTEAPLADAKVWALWMEPSASGGSGKGVNPPPPPDDLHINRLGWTPGIGVQWDDDRGDMHSVANAAARLALKDPEQIIPGSMVYERDTHDIWVYTPAGVSGTGPAPVAGTGATGTGGATVRQDVNLATGANFQAILGALNVGDTIFYKGQYYRMQVRNAMREIEFPGGTSYVMGTFNTNWTAVAGPSWNAYAAPATPGMANPAATTTGSTSSAPVAAGDPKLTTNWTMALKGHPTDNILRALCYDPAKPNSMAWDDDRDSLETVPTELDLLNRAVLPASHLTVGKLVYARDTGLLYESLVDGLTGTVTGTMADFKTLGGAGVTFVGRIGNLPDPTVKTIPDGSLFMVNMDLTGKEYHRLYVFDAQGTNAAGVVGVYRACSTKDFIKALRSDPDQGFDAEPGDIQVTLEAGHKEIKAVDATSTWQIVYSEDLVKQWVAASNLFQGTVEDKGHGTVGAIDLDRLPAQSALGITDSGHYYIYVGAAGHVIGANEIGGAASNIDGAKLNVGDWILAANTGTPTAPVMKYTHIPGDLLAKSRGDNLYGLNNWVSGAYEQGALVVYNGDIYKAAQAVLAADPAPGVAVTAPAVNPWAKVNISGGVKTVASDTNLPAGAANGAVYLVLSSAQAGGKGAMYMWDGAASKWQSLGGGGVPMSLGGGKKLINYGTPIGTVITFAGKVLPAGYKLCDGSTFDQTTYPELFKVLGNSNTLPDLRGQFIKGANTLADVNFTKVPWTTGMPKTHFTGVSNSAGSHNHVLDANGQHHHTTTLQMFGASGGGMRVMYNGVNEPKDYQSSDAGNHTHNVQNSGAHTHTIEVTAGGDAITQPDNVVLCYLIKVDDVGVHAP